jgi:hypothetical protein
MEMTVNNSPRYEKFKEPIKVATYSGHDIHLVEGSRFRVTAPEVFAPHEAFDSLDAAAAELDKRMATKNRQERTKLNLLGFDENGAPCTVVSIHQGTGMVIGASEDFYPRFPWVLEDIKQLAALRAEVSVISNRLHKIKVAKKRCWGKIDPSSFPQYVDRLTKEFERVHKLASKGRAAVTAAARGDDE